MTEPVKESPSVPTDKNSVTTKHDTQEMPVLKKDMNRAFRVNEIYTVLVAMLTAAVAVVVAYRIFVSEAKAAGKEAAQSVAERQDKLEESQKDVKRDMRDLYKAVMYGKRSERLERDPEHEDGGR